MARKRKPTTWATAEALTAAMAGMKPAQQRCRAFRHSMDVKPNSYRYSETGSILITLHCLRCGAYEKDIEYDASGGAVLDRRSAKYFDGYLLEDVGRIGSDVQGLLIDEIVQQTLRAEMAKSPRKPRARKEPE
jgi:hypothetical protein